MNPRLAKQIIYGTGYLAVFFLIIFIIYLIWFKPAPTCFDNTQNQGETGVDCGGPCLPCEIKTLTPLEVSGIKWFLSDDQTVILAEIKNSNINYGADFLSYTLDIYGKDGNKIKSLTKNSLIYAAEIKYYIEPLEINFQNIKEVKISFSNINWKSKEEFPRPVIQVREIKVQPLDKNSPIRVNGFVSNKNAFQLSKMRIIAILFDQNNIQLSASKTELENIRAFEEKSFIINFPANIIFSKVDPIKTRIYVEGIR